jgi:hypothetical protein
MKTIRLSELQEQIKRNYEKYGHLIEKFIKELEQRNLKKGRVRPKHPDEQKILDSFKRK